MSDSNILISAMALSSKLDTPGWAIVDCRFNLADTKAGRRLYEQGHIPGAVFLDLDEDLAGPVGPQTGRHPLPDPETIGATLGQLGITNSDSIVVYDGGNGAVASRAWWILRWLGHDSVFLLDGGYGHWESLGLPVSSDIPARAAGTFAVLPRWDEVLTTDELIADLPGIASLRLYDARDSARFRGEQEPIDSVAGHIPGTISLPFSMFVALDGTWLPMDQRRKRLEKVLGKNRDTPWAVMCGSGVTACHIAISGLEAGYRAPRLYVGSWSEWIRDPERPIESADT